MFSKSIRDIIFSIGLVAFLVLLGYLREILFVHIGYQIRLNYYHEVDRFYHYTFPSWLLFLKEYSSAQLIRIKWMLTVLTFLLYSGVTIGSIWYYFRSKTYLLITTGVQVFIFLLAGCLYVGGQLLGKGAAGYTLAREFMGIVQSPLVLMILLPTFIINTKQKKQQHEKR